MPSKKPHLRHLPDLGLGVLVAAFFAASPVLAQGQGPTAGETAAAGETVQPAIPDYPSLTERVELIRTVAEQCDEDVSGQDLGAAAQKGLEIALEADRHDTGFGDLEAELLMILRNRHGETAERELRMMTLEVPDRAEGDKSMVVFDRPRDVAGTSLLTFSKILEPDDQWMYLPALARIKRISSANKSGPFMGSEFAFEDFSSQEVGKYAYRFLGEEPCPGAPGLTCYKAELYPLYENSGYVKQIGWLDTQEYRNFRTEFYNRRCELLKVLSLSDHREYLDQYWRPHRLEMVNELTGKSTVLMWTEYDFRVGLDELDFSQNSLRRAR